MLPSYFDYIFVQPRQKARLRPELSPKFCQLWVPTRTEKRRPTNNSASIWGPSLTQLNMIAKRLILQIFYDVFYACSGGLPR